MRIRFFLNNNFPRLFIEHNLLIEHRYLSVNGPVAQSATHLHSLRTKYKIWHCMV